MDRQSWTYVSGLVSAQWERLMERRDLLAFTGIDSPEERSARLRSSLLFADAPPGGNLVDEVEEAFCAYVQRIAAVSPDDRIADLFLLERDWEEFRRFAKSVMLQETEPRRELRDGGAAELSPVEAAWRGDVEEERFTPFAEAAGRIASDCPREGDRAGWIDHVADAYAAASLIRTAARLRAEDLLDWVRTWATLRAALALIRARRLSWDAAALWTHWQAAGFDDPALAELAAGAEAEWPSALDKLGMGTAGTALTDLTEPDMTVRLAQQIDDRVTQLASASSGIPFGPERVFAFLWALRSEALNLRLALTAAEFGIPEKRLASALRIGHG